VFNANRGPSGLNRALQDEKAWQLRFAAADGQRAVYIDSAFSDAIRGTSDLSKHVEKSNIDVQIHCRSRDDVVATFLHFSHVWRRCSANILFQYTMLPLPKCDYIHRRSIISQ
jgi:hypothetical protein